MGAVAKATHLLRRAPVALKFMSPAVLALQGAVERFVNEGVAASQIDSDHVVKVFDVGRLPSGAPYLVMEFLDGQRPRPAARAGGRAGSTSTRAVHFALQILRALQTAHASGIIHRDMKPSNCFVIDKDGEPDFVKLVDFGISKVRTRRHAGPERQPDPHQQRPRHAALHVARAGPLAARRRPPGRPLLGRRHPLRASHGAHAVHVRVGRVHGDPLQDLHDRARASAQPAARCAGRPRRGRPPGARARPERALLVGVGDGRGARAVRGRAERAASSRACAGGRGRSLLPPDAVDDARGAAADGARHAGARANTYPVQPDPMRAPRVPTAAGLARGLGQRCAGAGSSRARARRRSSSRSSRCSCSAPRAGIVIVQHSAGSVASTATTATTDAGDDGGRPAAAHGAQRHRSRGRGSADGRRRAPLPARRRR